MCIYFIHKCKTWLIKSRCVHKCLNTFTFTNWLMLLQIIIYLDCFGFVCRCCFRLSCQVSISIYIPLSRYTQTGNVRSNSSVYLKGNPYSQPVQARSKSKKAVQKHKRQTLEIGSKQQRKCGGNIQGLCDKHWNRQGVYTQVLTGWWETAVRQWTISDRQDHGNCSENAQTQWKLRTSSV